MSNPAKAQGKLPIRPLSASLSSVTRPAVPTETPNQAAPAALTTDDALFCIPGDNDDSCLLPGLTAGVSSACRGGKGDKGLFRVLMASPAVIIAGSLCDTGDSPCVGLQFGVAVTAVAWANGLLGEILLRQTRRSALLLAGGDVLLVSLPLHP